MYEVQNGKLQLNHGSINRGLLAIASGKGGVGKSTVTVNLAIALKKMGNRVGIIDADVRGFSIPRIIGLKEEAKPVSEKEIMPPEADGVKVISMGSFVREDNPVIWRAPLLGSALDQFMTDVHWGELDYILLDLPPGTGDMPLNIMQKLPHAETVIVTTPQITATSVAGRIGKMAEKMDAGVVGVVENMSYYQCPECGHKEYIFGKGGGRELADQLETDFLGELPLVTSVREGGDRGKPIVDNDPESEVTGGYMEIAETLNEREKEFDPDIEPMNLKGESGK